MSSNYGAPISTGKGELHVLTHHTEKTTQTISKRLRNLQYRKRTQYSQSSVAITWIALQVCIYLFCTVNVVVRPFSCLGDGLQQASIMVSTKSKGVHCSIKRDHLDGMVHTSVLQLVTPQCSCDHY